MNKTQIKLLNLSRHQDLGSMSLRQIAKLVGVENKPQIIKHHLHQLEKAGYLKVSAKMLPRKKQDLYILVAEGLSMNLAEVREGITIEDGDFVIVDKTYKNPKDGDIIVAVIDNMGIIKRYKEDKQYNRIVLESVSTDNFMPIFIHKEDDFVISGKVIDVIKKNDK